MAMTSIFMFTLTFKIMFNWFIVPFGVQEINFLWSLGLLAFMFLFSKKKKEELTQDDERMMYFFIYGNTKALMVLAIGAVAKFFM